MLFVCVLGISMNLYTYGKTGVPRQNFEVVNEAFVTVDLVLDTEDGDELNLKK